MTLSKVQYTKFVPMLYLAPCHENVWDGYNNGSNSSMEVI